MESGFSLMYTTSGFSLMYTILSLLCGTGGGCGRVFGTGGGVGAGEYFLTGVTGFLGVIGLTDFTDLLGV